MTPYCAEMCIRDRLSAAASFSAMARPEWPSDTGILAESGIVMDKDSGAVIFGQNIHVPYAPASITKMCIRDRCLGGCSASGARWSSSSPRTCGRNLGD